MLCVCGTVCALCSPPFFFLSVFSPFFPFSWNDETIFSLNKLCGQTPCIEFLTTPLCVLTGIRCRQSASARTRLASPSLSPFRLLCKPSLLWHTSIIHFLKNTGASYSPRGSTSWSPTPLNSRSTMEPADERSGLLIPPNPPGPPSPSPIEGSEDESMPPPLCRCVALFTCVIFLQGRQLQQVARHAASRSMTRTAVTLFAIDAPPPKSPNHMSQLFHMTRERNTATQT